MNVEVLNHTDLALILDRGFLDQYLITRLDLASALLVNTRGFLSVIKNDSLFRRSY